MTGVYSIQTEFFSTQRLRDVQMILITHTRTRQQSTNQPAETLGSKSKAPYFCQFPVPNEILNPGLPVSVYYDTQQCSGPGVGASFDIVP